LERITQRPTQSREAATIERARLLAEDSPMMKMTVLAAILASIGSVAFAQQPQAAFDEIGEVHLTTVLVPKTTDKWITLISVTPPDAYGGGVEKWMWLSHPRQVATPQDLNMRGRMVFNGTTVRVLIAELPPIEFNFTGGNAAHLIGAWRARHEVEPMTHERILTTMLGTFERNGGR
jgi:hypothetical protein